MSRVQSGRVRHRPAAYRPFGDYGALFEIKNLHMAVSVDDVSHSHIQLFTRRLYREARRVAAAPGGMAAVATARNAQRFLATAAAFAGTSGAEEDAARRKARLRLAGDLAVIVIAVARLSP